MFPPLKTEIESRFDTVEAFFRSTKGFSEDLSATAKGMIFVQVYAIYEFTVRSAVQIAIDAINAHKTKIKDISPSLMALFLDPELEALKGCGPRNVWNNRLQIFKRAFSEEVVSLSNNTGPPHDGSHYRHTNLVMIFEVFGIKRLPVRRRRHLFRIDEVVDNRNQIAHGSETAEDVGRRYTPLEIINVINQMRSVCFLLVSVFETYCSDGSRHKRK